MRLLFIFIAVSGLLNIQFTVQAQNRKQSRIIQERQILLDSLVKHTISPEAIKQKYTLNTRSQKATFFEGKIILSNGTEAIFHTSNNKKTKELLSNLYSLSPTDFLLGLSGIEGLITIKGASVYWVKREDIPELMKFINVDVVTPQIKQYDIMNNNRKTPLDPYYKNIPLGINALNLIYNYLSPIFPIGLTPSYKSINDWYDNGMPENGYKFEAYVPLMGLGSQKRIYIKKN